MKNLGQEVTTFQTGLSGATETISETNLIQGNFMQLLSMIRLQGLANAAQDGSAMPFIPKK